MSSPRTAKLLKASAEENADLFWGLKGSGGNFGIVTSLEFTLYPLTTSTAASIYYPVEKASEVLRPLRQLDRTLPDEMTTSVAFLNFPPLPALPEALRGKSVIAVRGCYCGSTPEDGRGPDAPWRELGEPIMDALQDDALLGDGLHQHGPDRSRGGVRRTSSF